MLHFDEKEYERNVLPEVRALFREGRLPDEFLRYGLHLDEDDTAGIRTVTQAVHGYWAKKFNHPRDGALFKKLHADKKAREAIEKPDQRHPMRKRVADDRRAAEKAKFAELESWITTAAASGFLTPEAVQHLVTEFTARGLAETDIRARLAPIPMRQAAIVEPLDEGLPAEVRRQILTSLTVLGKADLYEFLAVPPGANKDQWRTQHATVYAKIRAAHADNKAAAANALLGIIKIHILDGDPANYEKARVYSLAEKLEHHVKIAGAGGPITQEKYDVLTAQALKIGLSSTDAPRAIRWLAGKNTIALSLSQTKPASFVVVCPGCHGLVQDEKPSEHCPHCRTALWMNCPECNARVLITTAMCGQCAFPTSRAGTVDGLLNLGASSLQKRDLADAERCLRDLEATWRGGRVAQFRTELDRVKGEVESLYQSFLSAEAVCQLFRARDVLNQLRAVGTEYAFRDGATIPQLEARLTPIFIEIQKHLTSARQFRANGNLTQAVLAFEAARALSMDCQEALDGLAQCPPEPATDLQASTLPDGVKLRWKASKALGSIDYVVVGHRQHAPATPADGETLATIRTPSFEDRSLINGATRYYSVFARRGTTCSEPAELVAPVFGAFETRNLTVVAGEGFVTGTWDTLPPHAKAVVTRNEPGDSAVSHVACDSSGFLDGTVVTGKRYDYRIAVEYVDPHSRTVRTPGVASRVSIDARPEPVTALKLTATASAVEVSWAVPPRGVVEIYALETNPTIEVGASLDHSALAAWPNRLAPTGPQSASASRGGAHAVYFVPVTKLGDWAVVGQPLRYLDLPDIIGLTAQHLGQYIELQWVWPPSCQNALVVWKHDGFPSSPDDTMAHRIEWPRGKYLSSGGFRLEQPSQIDHFFTVFAGLAQGDCRIYGGGISQGCRAHVAGGRSGVVRYSLRKSRWSKSCELRVASETTTLPDLVLVIRRDGIQPSSAHQGDVLVRVMAGPAPSPVKFLLHGSGYMRLFCADPADRQRVQILDPDPQQLRVD